MTTRKAENEELEALRAQIRAGQMKSLLAELEGLSAEGLVAAIKPWRSVAGRLYNEAKDLTAFVALSQALIGRLERALMVASAEERLLLAPPLCGTCYNVAAFAWAGWDEPGIQIGPYALSAGRRDGKRCLEVRQDPAHQDAKFGVTLEMAWWVIGAQALAVGDFSEAHTAFTAAAKAARAAGESDRLERGYLALTHDLATPFHPVAADQFQAVVAEYDPQSGVEPGEHDVFFRDQLLTAQRVFGGRE